MSEPVTCSRCGGIRDLHSRCEQCGWHPTDGPPEPIRPHERAYTAVAIERIPPGLSVAFDAAGRAFRWEPVPPIHFADEAIEPGDVLTVMPDGAVRLADRAEAARRAEASPVDRRDGSPAPGDDGADTAVVTRAEPTAPG